MTLFEEFEWRGMVSESTEGVREALANERVTAYIGFDPTASSLHVGILAHRDGPGAPAEVRSHADCHRRRRHRDDRRSERQVAGAQPAVGRTNRPSTSRGVRAQLERFLDFNAAPNAATIVNNADWLGAIDLLSFLRDVGKHFTVNYMLQKESVSRRLESADGISYTEFSYLILQAYDFLQLFDRHHCTLQMGGSDQWGNITAGIELIRKVRGKKAHGLVWPLLKTVVRHEVRQDGSGHGVARSRSAPASVISTSSGCNTDDRDVINYLKVFTWLDRAEIERARAGDASTIQPARAAQRTLAR